MVFLLETPLGDSKVEVVYLRALLSPEKPSRVCLCFCKWITQEM